MGSILLPDIDEEVGEQSQFLIPTSSLPSSENRTFEYRWPGQELSEGEIQLGSDKHVCEVVFGEPGGVTLNGTFRCEYVAGQIPFIGRKVDVGTSTAYDVWSMSGEGKTRKRTRGRG